MNTGYRDTQGADVHESRTLTTGQGPLVLAAWLLDSRFRVAARERVEYEFFWGETSGRFGWDAQSQGVCVQVDCLLHNWPEERR